MLNRNVKRVLLVGLAAFLGLLAVLVVRAVRGPGARAAPAPAAAIALDTAAIASHLSQAVRIPTITDPGSGVDRDAGFVQLRDLLRATYPLVHARLTLEPIDTHSLLYTWTGSNPALKPILLMGHQDVVPVDPASLDRWTHPPFSGDIAGGEIWGRGAIDDKQQVISVLEAVEYLLRHGLAPTRTVYLFFGADEEGGTGTGGAHQAAELLRSRGVRLEYVLDEGGIIAEGMVPGTTQPIALIRTAEKGYVTIELVVEGTGGHSSAPPRPTPVGILANAIAKLEAHPFPARLSPAGRDLLESVASDQPFANRVVLRNLWLFRPLVVHQLAKMPSTDATVRTTIAPTMLQASPKDNVLPSRALAIVNLRIQPGETVTSVVDRVTHVIDDERVVVRSLGGHDPSPTSSMKSANFARVRRTILEVAPGVMVAPFLLTAATDARQFTGLTDDVYGFSTVRGGPELLERAHGVNERIAIADLVNGVRFYVQLIRNSQ